MGKLPKYTPITCQTACHKVQGGFPYHWDLNVYRGCIHGCKYCYALYSHKYINASNFYEDIYVKTNIVEKLEQQLKHPSRKKEAINLGGVTDSYQAGEAQFKIMPEIWKLLIKYKNPVIISTKSDLILRDFDLINELSKLTYVNIALTITTMDEKVQKLIEPNATSSKKRFEVLKTFKNTNVCRGVHMMPILPYITDSNENVDMLFSYAKETQVNYVLPGVLYLRGQTKKAFFQFLEKELPHLKVKYENLYKTGGATKIYKNSLYQMINLLKAKHGISSDYQKWIKEKLPDERAHERLFPIF